MRTGAFYVNWLPGMKVIAIVGGSGSGKSYLSAILKEHYGDRAAILSYDSYYKRHDELTLEERSKLNYDDPHSLDEELLISHLKQLKRGETVSTPVYDFAIHNRVDQVVLFKAPDVLILEGIMVLTIPNPKEYIDFSIFVDAEEEVRLARRIERDIRERGRTHESVMAQWNASVKPMHDLHVEPEKLLADFVLKNNGSHGIHPHSLEDLMDRLPE